MKPASRQISFAPALLLIAGLLTSTAIAQTTSFWDGGSVGSNVTWTTTSNWVGDLGAPSASNSDLVFNNRTGGGPLPSALNLGADRIAGLITFDNINSVLPATLNIDTNASATTSPRTLTLFSGITLQNTTTTVYLRGNNSTMSIALGANNTFTTSTGSTLQIAPVISGAFRVTKAGEGTLIFEVSNTFTGGVTINQGTLRILTGAGVGPVPASFVADQVLINGGTLEYAGSGNTSSANRGFSLGSNVGVINVSSSSATYQIAGVISDVTGQAGVLRKTGTGTLYLNPGSGFSNLYSGGTTVASGTLQYGRTGSLGTGPVTIGSTDGGDATLDNALSGWTTTNNITVASGSGGTLSLIYSGTSNFNGIFTGTLTLNDNLTIRSDATTGFAMRITGAISGSSNITKTGTGVLRLENNNTGYTGTTTISTGTLQLSSNSTNNTDGTLGSGAIVNNGILLLSRTSSLTLANTMSGTGSLVQAGTGSITISNVNNTYSGGTTVASGTLQYGRTGSLGTGTITIGSTGGGSATLENYLAGWTTSNNIVVATGSGGTLTLSYTSSLTGSGNGLFTGTLTVDDNLTIRSDAGTGQAMRINGAISGTGNITKTGTGSLRIENDNTAYTGITTISSGSIQLGNTASPGTGTTGALGSGNIVNNAALIINRTNTFALANQISGTGTLTQINTATTTLSNANTYSGGTTVTAGTLLAANTTGSATGSGSVTTSSGTTLGGTGTLSPTASSSITIGGRAAPGLPGTNNGVGTLNFTPVDGNVTFQSTSSIAFELSASHTNDKIVFASTGAGALDLSAMTPGSLSVSFVGGYTPALNDSFDLLDWNNVIGLSDALLSLSTAGFDPSWSWDTTQFTTTGVITVISAVPEPSRLLFIASGLLAIILRRRRSPPVLRT